MPENTGAATTVKVKLNGVEVAGSRVLSFTVDLDLNQPDMCVLTLGNEGHVYSNGVNIGHGLEVMVGDDEKVIFKGEVVALEPSYRADGESKCVVRAFNRLHRLLRGRKSKTFVEQSDQDIASAIASENGLTAQCGSSPRITHKHVYQHNQTNLEFLRLRAARLGFDVWVDDTKLYFDQPKTDQEAKLTLVHGEASDSDSTKIIMKSFSPRMSSANVVKKVVVRGWDPEKKEEIVGEAVAASSSLGDKSGESVSTAAFGEVVTYEVDHPIFSAEEASAIAEARLGELTMNYITGEAWIPGNGDAKAGIVVEIEINKDNANDRFNGKYLLSGATHSYSHAKGGGGSGGGGGYQTQLRVARDAQKNGTNPQLPSD